MVARLERELRARAKPDPRVAALMTMPGVGWITAMTLVAEIGDINRFATARKLCAWAGLIPAVRNSDRTVRHGHITKQGSPAVRWVLCEAAQRAKTQPPFACFYAECARRRGRHIAIVAVTRKLLAPLLPHPQGGGRHRHHHRRGSPCRVCSRVSMRLRDGRFHD
jgi:transposase